MRTPEELTELFRGTGRKVTAQRQCIFRVLQGNVTHPSAEAVHALVSREMETVSLKTVYQTLHDLAELGEIASLDVGTGMTRFDPNVDHPHHHLVCRQCGSVRDLLAAFPALEIPAGADLGFEVGSAEIVFRGLCPACRPPKRSRRPSATATRR
jgi:Fe2+ or Zn2+ uptake regulation protein